MNYSYRLGCNKLDYAIKLTDLAEGKHHIGDFLPPDELKKFMETIKVNFRIDKYFFADYLATESAVKLQLTNVARF